MYRSTLSLCKLQNCQGYLRINWVRKHSGSVVTESLHKWTKNFCKQHIFALLQLEYVLFKISVFSTHFTMEQTQQTAKCAVCILNLQNRQVEGEGHPCCQEQSLRLLKEWDPHWYTTNKRAQKFSTFIMLDADCVWLARNLADDGQVLENKQET